MIGLTALSMPRSRFVVQTAKLLNLSTVNVTVTQFTVRTRDFGPTWMAPVSAAGQVGRSELADGIGSRVGAERDVPSAPADVPVLDPRFELEDVLHRQRQAFVADGPPSLAVRRNRIDRLLALVLDNTDAFVDAMAADFGTRSRAASLFTEVVGMIPVIEHTRSHVAQWMGPPQLMRAARAVRPEGRGRAHAAGRGRHHRAVELPAQPGRVARIGGVRGGQPRHDQDVGGHAAHRGADEASWRRSTSTRPNWPWSPAGPTWPRLSRRCRSTTCSSPDRPTVGALVQRAAAQNLVPVTLELGGKNPGGGRARRRHRHERRHVSPQARMVNGGQVCVCPDYVFVPEDRIDAFVDAARRDAARRCSRRSSPTPTTARASTKPNFDRVLGLIDDARAKGAPVEAVAPVGETAARPRDPQDRPDDRARRRRGDAHRPRGDLRAGTGGHGLLEARRRDRLHQQAARTAGGLLVRTRRRRLPELRRAAPAAAGSRVMTLPHR